jgi:hypothetical protein
MRLWQELLTTAIVGTKRQKFALSSNGDELSEILQAAETSDNETALLKTAGVLAVYHQAGIQLFADKESLAETAQTETAAYLNAYSAEYVTAMLAGNYAEMLAEFLSLTARGKQILPPEFLPEILDLGNQKRDLRSLILPIIGSRGRWLARHNADWRWALIEENATEIWQNGTRDERLFALELCAGKTLSQPASC